MENEEIRQKCEALLREAGVSGVIVFGWQKADKQFGVVYSAHEMPKNAATKCMAWALNHFIQSQL